MLTLSQAADLINEIEDTYPVSEWRVGSLRVWPIARTRLGYGLLAQAQRRPAPPLDAGLGAVLKRAGAATRGLAGLAHLASPSRFRGLRIEEEGSVALLSDGISFIEFDGRPYDRHLDPIRDGLLERGVSTLTLMPGRNPPPGYTPPTRYVQPSLDLATGRARLRRSPDVVAPGYSEVVGRLGGLGYVGCLPSTETLGYAAAVLDAQAEVFGRVLSKVDARVGLAVCYYDLRAMAFVLACRRLGLPSVDVQHGVEGELHFAYGRWGSVPPCGYELLPKWFWVWSEADAHVIEKWSRATQHKVIVGGNRLLDAWIEGPSELTAQFDRELASASAFDRTILVSLNGGEGRREIADVVAMVRAGEANWRWWIRMHPTDRNQRGWRIALDAARIRNAEVERPSALPLFALLRHADVHVTRFSSVVVDAAQFGVPSVVTDSVGAELFANEVRGDWVTVATGGPEETVRALRRLRRRSPDHACTGQGIEWITAMAQGGSK